MSEKPGLSLPMRRLIACAGIIVFLFVYIFVVASLGQMIHGGKITALLFYALAGTLWGVPLIPLISWSENYKGRKKK
ncbi:MAG: DUF2842 domain-containing protein [Asticcacaulis sp.]|nr:DUF2842 domain-containing protein [Asticcacaulis sp.]